VLGEWEEVMGESWMGVNLSQRLVRRVREEEELRSIPPFEWDGRIKHAPSHISLSSYDNESVSRLLISNTEE
jgi:hypothetical protein